MAGVWFVLGLAAGACFAAPFAHYFGREEGAYNGRWWAINRMPKTYFRRVADLLDVHADGEDIGEVVQWALEEANKPNQEKPE